MWRQFVRHVAAICILNDKDGPRGPSLRSSRLLPGAISRRWSMLSGIDTGCREERNHSKYAVFSVLLRQSIASDRAGRATTVEIRHSWEGSSAAGDHANPAPERANMPHPSHRETMHTTSRRGQSPLHCETDTVCRLCEPHTRTRAISRTGLSG